MVRQRRQELSRDTRLKILTLHDARFTYQAIRDHFLSLQPPQDISLRQIQTAIAVGRPTPQKKGNYGAKPSLSEEQIDEIEVFIISSKTNRLLSFFSLAAGPFKQFQVSEDVIQSALEKRGYHRRIARVKPPISEKNR